MPSLTISPVPEEDKSVLQHLMELYTYEFSVFEDLDVNAHGVYGYEYLDHYWTEEWRHPFLIRHENRLAGFILIREMGEKDGVKVYSMAEFFILLKYRRLGLGRQAAFFAFDRFPGNWHVSEVECNLGAQAFWRKVIGEYTGGNYQEEWRWKDERRILVQTFSSVKPQPAQSLRTGETH